MLNSQVQVYSVDTKGFYHPAEEVINESIINSCKQIKNIEQFELVKYLDMERQFDTIDELLEAREDKDYNKKLNKVYKKNKKTKEFKNFLKKSEHYKVYQEHKKNVNKKKKELKELLVNDKETVRVLNPEKISKYKIVSIFDSYLTRTLGLEYGKLSTDLIIVKVYRYSVLEQLLLNGFTYLDEQYIFFAASAGQIRTKKIIMIKENVWNEYRNTLMCGLSVEDINNKSFEIDGEIYYGCNTNKFLAYLALCTGATDIWKKFNIDKAIIIDDFESIVSGEVDFIDDNTFVAERMNKDITITHSDGCGWILPSESKINFMCRLPWLKGLMTPVDYLFYCEQYRNEDYQVVDIYGKEWDLLKDDIRYVFSKSQFKMHKYYPNIIDEHRGIVLMYGWDIYKENFKKHKCHASICNSEPKKKDDFVNKHIPYQMWQTLIDMTDEEIECITENTVDYIMRSYIHKDFMLDILGVNNKNKNYLQKALTIYPELLREPYVQSELSSVINSKKNDAKYGKFVLGDNCKYTYILPDVWAWLQHSLGGNQHREGILKNGEVCCKLFAEEEKISVNRNPHLYKEWAVRNNVIDYRSDNWFITNGVYVSCHDLISKLIMNDWDGDTSLVVKGKLVGIAERNMEGIVPLFYDMGVAKPEIINAKNIYTSLTTAFKYGNIGKYSNKLTKLWNDDNYDLDVAKAICTENNFSIDYAKTLYMPEIDNDELESKIKELDDTKMPYFFQYVKKNYKNNVEAINDSTVNRIAKEINNIPQNRYDFSKVGNFRYDTMLRNKKIKINQIVIDEYIRLNNDMKQYCINKDKDKDKDSKLAIWDILRYDFSLFCDENNIKYEDAVDMCIKYMFNKDNRNKRKEFLFQVFGDVIVENLKKNLGNTIVCARCIKRTEKKSNRQIMCSSCADEVKKEKDRKRKRK